LTERCELVTTVKSTEEFIESLLEKLLLLLHHSFIATQQATFLKESNEEFIESLLEKLLLPLRHSFNATQQAMFLKELKCNLQSGEFVVLCDFAENYSFILQFCKMKHKHFTGTMHKPTSIHL
jgi:hypothetical protein